MMAISAWYVRLHPRQHAMRPNPAILIVAVLAASSGAGGADLLDQRLICQAGSGIRTT
jgi:hypothetical protein